MTAAHQHSHAILTLGLGRCAIGNLKKHLRQCQTDRNYCSFTHHYLLNNQTLLLSHPEDLLHFTEQHNLQDNFAPSIADQILSLDNIKNFNVLIIELFPPAPIYKLQGKNVFACFESITEKLTNFGFEPWQPNNSPPTNGEAVIAGWQQLILQAKQANPELKIIFLNGEFFSQNGKKHIGSNFIPKLISALKNSRLLNNPDIKLIDINDLLEELAQKELAFYDTEFPYQYIRHTPQLIPIGVCRDCKHSSSFMRDVIVHRFFQTLKEWDLFPHGLKNISVDRAKLPRYLRKRGERFLREYSGCNFLQNHGKNLAKYIFYAAELENHRGQRVIQDFIKSFNLEKLDGTAPLSEYFYHLRSACAYIYLFPKEEFFDFCLQNVTSLLGLEHDVLQKKYQFSLLWLKNLILAANRIISQEVVQPAKAAQYLKTLQALQNHFFFADFSQSAIILQRGLETLRKIHRRNNSDFKTNENTTDFTQL